MTAETHNSNEKPAWTVPIELRKERADYYFETILKGQRQWYSKNAGKHRQRDLTFALLVIILGAMISVLQTINLEWVRYLTATLGAAVTIFRIADTLLHPAETWNAYRKASESMKREYRLYLNDADVYADAPDEETAYRLLVERVETVIAEEQQIFWQFQSKGTASKQKTTESENGK
ncbi:MAG: DUF4231 domain-containing protein [Methylococcales bacterium]